MAEQAPALAERPYGRHRVAKLGETPPASAPPTYYGRPALKPSDWRWLIITYFFVGGMAGAAQVIAGVVDLVGHHRHRALVSAARYLALGGALISPVLLIADLRTPSRWYNMLRIYRGTSPMSIGSWTLAAFGAFSGLAAMCQLASDLLGSRRARTFARWTGVPAAASGALLATYTGALLSATSSPLWATSYRLLPATFGVSGTAAATAMLTLMLQRTGVARNSQWPLVGLATLVGALELGLMLRLDRIWRREGVYAPLQEPPLMLPYRVGVLGLGMVTPLSVHLIRVLTGRELRGLATLAPLATLIGGFTLRAVITFAGKRSSERPSDYFGVAQPAVVPDLGGSRAGHARGG